jgi:hypothetical protein
LIGRKAERERGEVGGGGGCERKRNGGNEWEGSFGSVVVRLFGMDSTV